MNLDTSLRLFVLSLHILRYGYWFLAEKNAHIQKPLQKEKNLHTRLGRAATTALGLCIGLQLLGFQILPFSNTVELQLLGTLLVVLGIGISTSARRTLATNWTHAAEYQLKKNQQLITNGIYAFIRHPIYFGMSLAYVGSELVVGSWLCIPLAVILVIVNVHQARKEERLLEEHFGEKYRDYMKKSYRFIPYFY